MTISYKSKDDPELRHILGLIAIQRQEKVRAPLILLLILHNLVESPKYSTAVSLEQSVICRIDRLLEKDLEL
jgi:hypothetical protein